ncbi:condensin-2 complex subunit D3-like [Plodia interpunctella]|uniref:condensin-2 complex subunit D3-like n=1 Tax=Plodia interpunctella TaxID=58824 RepID=UPI0023689304|nr:condensin-2 complex subunit D3-like [Plodia interpunctella]
MEVINELNKLDLDSLDEEWMQAIYYAEFLEFGEIPPEYERVLESINIKKVFHNIMKSIDTWLNAENSEEEKSWTTLSHQVNHQKLLALLAYYIDYGGKNVHTLEYRNNTLLSSRLYFKLLSIPGYKAYHIYHSQLFAHSLVCLSFPKVMCENEDNYFNTRELTREVNSVIRELQHFVLDLRAVIEKLHLNPTDMNFEDILSNLVDITGGAIVNKLNVDKIDLANVSRVIYEMIDILICDSNRDVNESAIRLLFKCILPKLVAASVDCRNANNLVRASYVTYSGLLLTKYGKAALPGYIVLLQHLCYTLDGLERAEVRSARVSLVFGLMSLLPKKSYKKIVKWLLTLSTTSKVSHRQIAMELLAKLLSNDSEEQKPKGTTDLVNPENPEQDKGDKPEGEVANNTETSQTENTNEEAEPATQLAPSTDDDSSQESQPAPLEEDMTEDEVAGLLRQRAHTVPHLEILHAVYERLHDVSSTLRARALAILTDSLASEHEPLQLAVKELNAAGPEAGAVSRLLAAGARCVCDERAAVRRAAVPLLQRLLGPPAVPAAQDLLILVGLCRDASILVRSASVAALGELLCQAPSDALFDAFLSGPMHQLSDPEIKVQDQVVTLLQQIVISRLQKYDAGEEDPLPWMFLGGVTRHNMRRHLMKACSLLAKTENPINIRTIDTLSTHLGVKDDARDLQCLVLLTSAAKLVNYSEVGFILEYYYKLTDDTKARDCRLLPLTLELLSSWSRWSTAAARSELREHLVRRLAAAPTDDCRIASAALAAQLDPTNLTWATELMQLSESRAVWGGSVAEWVRAADLSLHAPAPPRPDLLRLFLRALQHPPPEWDESSLGAMVAGAGRLCVRSRESAAQVAPALAALLQEPQATLAPRLNALRALTDICTRYTCIVDPLLPAICGCLGVHTAPPLRRAAARALTRLLLAGYLRLRTPLYYTFCALLADDDHDVREPAEYYVTSCLSPDTIYHHFVDCVLHYNSDRQTENISFDARQLIYDVMLQRLSLVQKLNVQCRLAREVLQHAADQCDEVDDLPPGLHAALLDTITLLCGVRMKLPKKPQNTGDADIDDLQERVTTNIVSHKMKRTVAEVLVPAVLRLYARLGARGGQLAVYLVRIATDLLSDYRQEIEELIENDEELVVRIQQFQENIGQEQSFGNSRNLVTRSAPPEPDTPRAPRRRLARSAVAPPRKRALRI